MQLFLFVSTSGEALAWLGSVEGATPRNPEHWLAFCVSICFLWSSMQSKQSCAVFVARHGFSIFGSQIPHIHLTVHMHCIGQMNRVLSIESQSQGSCSSVSLILLESWIFQHNDVREVVRRVIPCFVWSCWVVAYIPMQALYPPATWSFTHLSFNSAFRIIWIHCMTVYSVFVAAIELRSILLM